MRSYQYKSLIEFTEKYDINKLGKNDLIISDIDGVFLNGIFDPREILGVISKENLEAFEKLLKTQTAFWFFTNRWAFFKHFPFIKQLSKSINKTTTITPTIYSNCSQFLEDRLQNYVIILNSMKPWSKSLKVVEKGIESFEKVVYVGAQDTPFYNTDKIVVNKLERSNINIDNLTFISIR